MLTADKDEIPSNALISQLKPSKEKPFSTHDMTDCSV